VLGQATIEKYSQRHDDSQWRVNASTTVSRSMILGKQTVLRSSRDPTHLTHVTQMLVYTTLPWPSRWHGSGIKLENSVKTTWPSCTAQFAWNPKVRHWTFGSKPKVPYSLKMARIERHWIWWCVLLESELNFFQVSQPAELSTGKKWQASLSSCTSMIRRETRTPGRGRILKRRLRISYDRGLIVGKFWLRRRNLLILSWRLSLWRRLEIYLRFIPWE